MKTSCIKKSAAVFSEPLPPQKKARPWKQADAWIYHFAVVFPPRSHAALNLLFTQVFAYVNRRRQHRLLCGAPSVAAGFHFNHK